jgi:hypothetical protein
MAINSNRAGMKPTSAIRQPRRQPRKNSCGLMVEPRGGGSTQRRRAATAACRWRTPHWKIDRERPRAPPAGGREQCRGRSGRCGARFDRPFAEPPWAHNKTRTPRHDHPQQLLLPQERSHGTRLSPQHPSPAATAGVWVVPADPSLPHRVGSRKPGIRKSRPDPAGWPAEG